MNEAVLSLNIVRGPVIVTAATLSIAAVIVLVARRPTRLWMLTAALGMLGGAAAGALTLFITVTVLDLFGTRLTPLVDATIILTFAAVGLAIVNLWRSRWWRKSIAVVGVVVFVVSGTLGVNAIFGLNKTVAAFFGVTNAKPLTLPAPAPGGGMPAVGAVGTISLPHDVSGFLARTALAYVPPAGLVENPPALPVVIQLNGQPGSPGLDDPKAILDRIAAQHNGHAPIVVNPDQLGDDSRDPMCLDTARGNVETYITRDVVPWVKQHFHVLQDPKDWTIVGFSNGGMCAAYFGAAHPEIFGNIVDISGDEHQGISDPQTVQSAFGGDQSRYESFWPISVMSRTHYTDTHAVFIVGADDADAGPGVQRTYRAAVAAGMSATLTVIPATAHDNHALDAGLEAGYTLVYNRTWGTPLTG